MRKSKFSDAQIMGVLRQVEGGLPLADVCREHGISSAPSATSGWINRCSQPSRRCRTTPQNGCGHTTTTAPTWGLAGSHPLRN